MSENESNQPSVKVRRSSTTVEGGSVATVEVVDEHVGAVKFEIANGILHVRGSGNTKVAAYAAGRWIDAIVVKPETSD